jgi:hypothetical protein
MRLAQLKVSLRQRLEIRAIVRKESSSPANRIFQLLVITGSQFPSVLGSYGDEPARAQNVRYYHADIFIQVEFNEKAAHRQELT